MLRKILFYLSISNAIPLACLCAKGNTNTVGIKGPWKIEQPIRWQLFTLISWRQPMGKSLRWWSPGGVECLLHIPQHEQPKHLPSVMPNSQTLTTQLQTQNFPKIFSCSSSEYTASSQCPYIRARESIIVGLSSAIDCYIAFYWIERHPELLLF
jgi:hypothetical protein